MTAPRIEERYFRPPSVYDVRPRQGATRGRFLAWITIRATGVLLSILVLGHFGMTHILTDVSNTGSSFVTRRWASLVWLVWDWLLLGCALLHGASGIWVAITDYSPSRRSRTLSQRLLVSVSALIFLIGSAAIVAVGRR